MLDINEIKEFLIKVKDWEFHREGDLYCSDHLSEQIYAAGEEAEILLLKLEDSIKENN